MSEGLSSAQCREFKLQQVEINSWAVTRVKTGLGRYFENTEVRAG